MRIVVALAFLASTLALVLDGGPAAPQPVELAGKCVGADPCRACVSCRSCKHCKGGGTCGACKAKKPPAALAYFGDPVCR